MVTRLSKQGRKAVCLGSFHLEKYSNKDLWNIPLAETRLRITYSRTAEKPRDGTLPPHRK